MQFTVAIVALFATAAFAAPTVDVLAARDVAVADAMATQAQTYIANKEAAGCTKLKCIIALAPNAVSCAAALAEGGVNPVADAACLLTLTKNLALRPAACANC